jgi:F-type H+-transporting ATPase subunit gamma
VTRRRDIDRHLRGLGEIREILGAMRNLALLETRKLARAVANQERVVASIRAALGEALVVLPVLTPPEVPADDVLIVLGSERGFCGDFNRVLLAQLPGRDRVSPMPVIVVGARLASRLPAWLEPVARLPGATTTEEVSDVLVRLMRELGRWRDSRPGPGRLRPAVLHHARSGEVVRTVLDPAGEAGAAPRKSAPAPRTQLAPEMLIEKLTEHFLYAVFHQVFHGSLMAENEQRMLHMESALHRMDEQTEELRRRRNGLRQEEITEEIEVITLTTSLRAT